MESFNKDITYKLPENLRKKGFTLIEQDKGEMFKYIVMDMKGFRDCVYISKRYEDRTHSLNDFFVYLNQKIKEISEVVYE